MTPAEARAWCEAHGATFELTYGGQGCAGVLTLGPHRVSRRYTLIFQPREQTEDRMIVTLVEELRAIVDAEA